MIDPIAVSLATSTAGRIAAVDALALLAAVLVAVSVVGTLAGLLLADRAVGRPYRLGIAPLRTTRHPSANHDVRDAA